MPPEKMQKLSTLLKHATVATCRLPVHRLKCELSFFSLSPYQASNQPQLNMLVTPLADTSTLLCLRYETTHSSSNELSIKFQEELFSR